MRRQCVPCTARRVGAGTRLGYPRRAPKADDVGHGDRYVVHAVQRRALVAAMLAALFAAPQAQAQPEDEEAPLPPPPVEAPPTRLGPVEVTARGTAADWPSALATDTLDYREAVAAPVEVQDWVLRTPGVAATGQNGLFETFSIRGNGGNAILTLVGGMPITAQRRAGVPLSFVDPLLLGDVSVTRGPAVTHFGPGALGGAVSVEPRWFDVPTLAARLASGGDEQLLMAATGNNAFSLAVARQEAGNAKAPDGTRLNTAYQRDSAVLQVRTRVGDLDVDALLMPSRSTDIGKSNSRFPARSTTYPIDRHSIGRLRLRHANGLELGLRGHAQRLDTLNQRPGSPDNFASIESTDLGLTLQRRFQAGALDYNLGLEYLGRRDVDGFDARGTLANRTYSLQDAREANLSAFAISDWALSTTLDLELGARGTRVTQRQRGAEADDGDAAFTAGAVWRPNAGSRWTLNLSSGYRFPTLEERYFSGVTAQGDIAGNPDLGSEHSLGIDLGFGWNTGPWSGSTHVWRMGVDDLIQLARLQGDLNGYVNIGEARLYGAETEVDLRLDERWSLRASGAWTRGEDRRTGLALYGIGPPDLALEARHKGDRHNFALRYAHRSRMQRPGFEEVSRSAVDTLDLDAGFRLRDDLELRVFVRNALDQRYFATADVLSALAPERSIGLQLLWQGR